ncbi:MAG: DinB family protein [Fimbriimonas sp.]
MPVPKATCEYLLTALSAQPAIASALLARALDDASVWDKRPDPERFSLREVLAHLADWDSVWLDRVHRIVSEDHPFLPSVDEELMVTQNGYATREGSDSLTRYTRGRQALVEFLRSLPEEAWNRTCSREFIGDLTLYQQAAMALSHDGYHMKQIVEWTRS